MVCFILRKNPTVRAVVFIEKLLLQDRYILLIKKHIKYIVRFG